MTPECIHQFTLYAIGFLSRCNSSIKYVTINVTINTVTTAEVAENLPKALGLITNLR